MALKKKLSKADFDKLSAEIKKEYTADGDDYLLDVDGEEDVGALKRANDRLKLEKKEAKEALKEAQDKLAETEEIDNKKKGDVEALEKSWSKKLETQATEFKGKIDKLTASLTKSTLGSEASKLAAALSSKAPKLLLPFIEKRLQADFEGDEPKIRILDKDGKPSAMTFADLQKEFVDNADFSAIITASKATGGAGADKTKTGGALPNENDKPILLSDLSPEKMAERMKQNKQQGN